MSTSNRTASDRQAPLMVASKTNNAQLVKGGDFKKSLRRLLRSMRPERRELLLMLALGVVSIILNVIGPRLLGRATDVIVAGIVGPRTQATGFTPESGIDFGRLLAFLLAALSVYVISGLCWIAQGRQTAKIIQLSASRFRAEIEAKLARLPMSYLDGRQRGELLSRLTNDIDNIAQSMQQSMSQLTNSLLLIVGVLAMMFWISPLLAFVTLVTVPVSAALTRLLGKWAQSHFRRQWSITGRLNAHVEEMYSGYLVVRAFGQQRQATAAFDEQNDALFQVSAKAQFVSGLISPLMAFVSNINYVLVAVVGGLRVASGTLTVGEVLAFVQYSRQFSGPLTQVTSLASVVQSGVASAERVFELLDAPEQSEDSGRANQAAAVRGQIRFDSVSFQYEAGKPVIKDLTLSVDPGQTVAIVGPTGAGKTTLVNLLMRFYDTTAGQITLDGVDIATISREELRSSIGLVLQDTWLFKGTVAENIAYGKPGVSREDIVKAARAAHVDHVIRTLPLGYDTIIDDDGVGVSVGERQLITIARAFLSDPAIMILDEATSSVDTRTELLIRRAITDLTRGRTNFLIAHRLSTVKDADTILVVNDGSVVEHGTHAQLLASEGIYARLFLAQFTEPTAEATLLADHTSAGITRFASGAVEGAAKNG